MAADGAAFRVRPVQSAPVISYGDLSPPQNSDEEYADPPSSLSSLLDSSDDYGDASQVLSPPHNSSSEEFQDASDSLSSLSTTPDGSGSNSEEEFASPNSRFNEEHGLPSPSPSPLDTINKALVEASFSSHDEHSPSSHELSAQPRRSLTSEIEEIEEERESPIPAPHAQSPPAPPQLESLQRSPNPVPLLKLLAIIGGATIGYALNVTGGVVSMPIFLNTIAPHIYIKKVHAKTDNFCPYINFRLLVFTSTIPLSASISIWIGLIYCHTWGRRLALWSALALLLVGVSCVIWSPLQSMQIIGMIFIGLSVGFLRQVIPTICFEIAPVEKRGSLDRFYRYSLFTGNTLALLVNYIASSFPRWGWRASLGFPYVSIFCMVLVSFFITETPQHFIERKELGKAKQILKSIREDSSEIEFRYLVATPVRNNFRRAYRQLLRGRECPILVINGMGKILPQLSGTNSLLYFGPLLLGSLRSRTFETFLAPLIVSGIGFTLASFFAFLLLGHLVGRRRLMLISVAAVFLSEIFLLLLFLHLNPNHHLGDSDALKASGLLLVCAIGDALLTGPHGWITDAYSHETSAIGAVWEDSASMFMTFVMGVVSLYLLCHLRAYTFAVFAICSIITASFIYLLVPETTSIKSHGIVRRIWMRHFFWKRCMLGEDLDVELHSYV